MTIIVDVMRCIPLGPTLKLTPQKTTERGYVTSKAKGSDFPSILPHCMHWPMLKRAGYFLFVAIGRNELRVRVRPMVYEKTRTGDSIIVTYYYSRWHKTIITKTAY